MPGLAVVDRVEALRKELDAVRARGGRAGLVPTMGYLHDGHTSLVRRSARECDVTVVTVFVNPLQFGPGEDHDSYPRDAEHDAAVAADAGANLLFVPPVEELQPRGLLTRVRVDRLGDVLEGASRPGHFAGVATVVAQLFNAAGACRAYFGEKDFQQLVVVRRMAADLCFPVEVVGCPTWREADGLACSSRNVYLAPAERRAATVLHRALVSAAGLVAAGERRPAAVRAHLAQVVASEPLAELDYAEVVSASDLGRLGVVEGEVRLLVAARLGRARLIDNLGLVA